MTNVRSIFDMLTFKGNIKLNRSYKVIFCHLYILYFDNWQKLGTLKIFCEKQNTFSTETCRNDKTKDKYRKYREAPTDLMRKTSKK